MDNTRWHHQILRLIYDYEYMKALILEAIEVISELKREDPRDNELDEQYDELRQLLPILDDTFRQKLQEIRNNLQQRAENAQIPDN